MSRENQVMESKKSKECAYVPVGPLDVPPALHLCRSPSRRKF